MQMTRWGLWLQPKFMSKKQREEAALKRREEEVLLQRARCASLLSAGLHPARPFAATHDFFNLFNFNKLKVWLLYSLKTKNASPLRPMPSSWPC